MNGVLGSVEFDMLVPISLWSCEELFVGPGYGAVVAVEGFWCVVSGGAAGVVEVGGVMEVEGVVGVEVVKDLLRARPIDITVTLLI